MSHNINLLSYHFTISYALHSCETINRKVNCGLTPLFTTTEYTFTKRSPAMTAHVDLLAAAGFHVRVSPSITAFIHRAITLNECPFYNPLGVAGRGSPHLKLLALAIPYSGNPKGTFGTVFALVSLP